MHPAIRITEERTFSATLGERTITGLAIASAWEGLTKYTNHAGEHLIVLDAEQRVITASPTLIADLCPVTPVVGQPFDGGIYAGLTEVDGKTAHLVLLPGEEVDVNWRQATVWANKNGALPTRAEQLTLYTALQGEFSTAVWYWSSEQCAADPAYAWGQNFLVGGQSTSLKSSFGRARTIRRSPIQ